MLRELISHHSYANALLTKAIGEHQPAAQDTEFRRLLHHIDLANRHWFLLIVNEPFDFTKESQPPSSLEAIVSRYKELSDKELAWVSRAVDEDLNRQIASPFLPDLKVSVAEAMLQVCLHSAAHRAQIAAKLRELGGKPPILDFILWLKDRPAADWSWAQ